MKQKIYKISILSNQRLKTSNVLMLMNFISNDYCNKLGNASQKQIGMKRYFVLRFTVSHTKTVFEVVDGFFNVYTDFICFFPFCLTPFYSWIGTKILFRINVNHPPTGRCCAGIITMAYTAFCFIRFIVFPFHFRADKFHRRDFAF